MIFWKIIIFITIVFNMIYIPLKHSFFDSTEGLLSNELIIIIFMADIIINLNTGFYKNGNIIFDRR